MLIPEIKIVRLKIKEEIQSNKLEASEKIKNKIFKLENDPIKKKLINPAFKSKYC